MHIINYYSFLPSTQCEFLRYIIMGSGDSSVEECWTCDWKIQFQAWVVEERSQIQFQAGVVGERSQIQFQAGVVGERSTFCADSFWYIFYPCVTAVTLKRSWSFCQKCKWQVTAKHTCTIHMCLQMKWDCKLVYCCMVYTEHVPKQQQFQVAPAMWQPNSTVSTPLQWIFKKVL